MTKAIPVVRHFTATAFVVHEDHVALHWHPKVKAWLPPGGHIEANEDPVQAVLREIEEETGLAAEVVSSGRLFELDYPPEVPPPLTIMVEDIDDPEDGFHQHIDMIYVCRALEPVGLLNPDWLWVRRRELEDGLPLERAGGPPVAPPEDVRVIGRRAFEVIADAPP